MPNHAHREKRVRQTLRRQRLNRWHKSRISKLTKSIRAAVDSGDAESAHAELTRVNSALDKAAKRGTIHKRNAARRMARLAKAVKTIDAHASV
jgi:small subunit ribosomal protein S20